MKVPPLALGACLILWGLQTGNAGLAAALALILEGARWVRWRWEFGDHDFNRVADFSSLLFLVMVIYQFTNLGIHGIYAILRLLPLILSLLVLAQYYSERGTIRLSALFVSLRRKRGVEADPDDREIDLGYPFALICLLSASAGERSLWFFPVMAGLVAVLAWPARPGRYRAPVWIASFALACAVAYGGQYGIQAGQRVIERAVLLWFNDMMWADTDPNRATTAIGAIGRLKLSDRIRVRVEADGPVPLPLLLREASYDRFGYGSWSTASPKFEVVDPDRGGQAWTLDRGATATRRLTITTTRKKELGVIPVPYGAARVVDEDLLEVQRNRYRTVQIEAPPGQLSYTVMTDPARLAGDGPPEAADATLPVGYADEIMAIARELGLPGLTPPASVRAIRDFFSARFRYSLIQRDHWPGRMPLIEFLRTNRQGHCEYFASATVLLLRAAGIPARYTVGYSVTEYSYLEKQYIARARHAHSWAEAWLDARWQVVDTTPALWADLEEEQASGLQPLLDLWSWLGYQFERIRAGDSGLEDYYAWALPPLIGVLAWRLYRRKRVRSRSGVERGARRALAAMGLDSEFPALVARLEARGSRLRPGEPLGPWLERIRRGNDSPALETALGPLLALHYRYRFDPRGITAEERESLRARVRDCLGH